MTKEIETVGDLIKALSKCNKNDKVCVRGNRCVSVVKEPGAAATYIDVH